MILHGAGFVLAAVNRVHALERNALRNALRRAKAVAAGFPGRVSAGGASVRACVAGRWTNGRPLASAVEDGVEAQKLAAATARSQGTGQAVRL